MLRTNIANAPHGILRAISPPRSDTICCRHVQVSFRWRCTGRQGYEKVADLYAPCVGCIDSAGSSLTSEAKSKNGCVGGALQLDGQSNSLFACLSSLLRSDLNPTLGHGFLATCVAVIRQRRSEAMLASERIGHEPTKASCSKQTDLA